MAVEEVIDDDVATILAEVRALRAEVGNLHAEVCRIRRQTRDISVADALVDAITDRYGTGKFGVADLAALVDEIPNSRISLAIEHAVDLNRDQKSWRTSLGLLLANNDRVERVGESGGSAWFRVIGDV